jgi:hypothetical protein
VEESLFDNSTPAFLPMSFLTKVQWLNKTTHIHSLTITDRTERHRQTNRQTDRDTDRQTERQGDTDRQTERQTDRQNRETGRHRNTTARPAMFVAFVAGVPFFPFNNGRRRARSAQIHTTIPATGPGIETARSNCFLLLCVSRLPI